MARGFKPLLPSRETTRARFNLVESMNEHEKLNYVEFAAADLQATKSFFETAFNWSFVDYGPDYTAFSGQGLAGGFFRAGLCSTTAMVQPCLSSIAIISRLHSPGFPRLAAKS